MTHSLHAALRAMPKVELHVHFEGSMQPDTVLTLARRHGFALPVSTVEQFREWFRFRDFPHFAEIYGLCGRCLQTPDDIEWAARAFLTGQAAQHIVYSEVTFTAYARHLRSGMSFGEMMDAMTRARAWSRAELGVDMRLIIDIDRDMASPAEAITLAEWVADYTHDPAHADPIHGGTIAALGLGGYEVGFPVGMFADGLRIGRERGLPLVLHAGETAGPESIWAALEAGAVRIGHGVRCLEDPALVEHLRRTQIPLEVCPTSNVRLKVVPSLADHPLPRLIEAGLYVTLNSDDPPMFDTTLTDEFIRTAEAFGYGLDDYRAFGARAIAASLLPDAAKAALHARFAEQS